MIVYSVSSYWLDIVFPGLIYKFSYFSLFYCPSLSSYFIRILPAFILNFFFSYNIFNIQKLFLTVCSFLKSSILFFFSTLYSLRTTGWSWRNFLHSLLPSVSSEFLFPLFTSCWRPSSKDQLCFDSLSSLRVSHGFLICS